jgi:hypothetical protein
MAQDPVARLASLLNKDGKGMPSEHTLTGDLFATVLQEVRDEKAEKAKVAAKDLIFKALEMKETRDRLVRDFAKTMNKFDKEFTKHIGRIESMSNGKRPGADGDDAENAETETETPTATS